MIADEPYRQFHRDAAEQLQARYKGGALPEGFYGVLAWHWALARSWPEAIDAALNEAEERIAQQNIYEARFWCERALEHLSRLSLAEQAQFALRTYSLAWTVLDFGGQHEEALYYAQRLQVLAHETQRPTAEGAAWLALGRSQRALFDFAAAEQSLQHALDIARQHELLLLEAEALFHLGKIQQMQGRHMEAIQHYNAAHEKGVVVDDRLTIAKIITSIGDVYRILGAGKRAAAHYERALEIEEHLPGILGIAIVQEKLALSYIEFGEYEKALRCQAESLLLRQQANDNVGMARAYTVLGMIHTVRGDTQTAIDAYGQALQLERSLQNVHGLTSVHNRLGDVYKQLGNYGEASNHYAQALDYARQLNDQLGIALIYERLGTLAHDWNDLHAAQQHWSAALAIRQQLGHYEEQQRLRRQLNDLGGQA